MFKNTLIIFFILLLFSFCVNKDDDSVTSLSKSILNDSLNPELYYKRGYNFYNNKDYDFAVYDFRNAHRLDSVNIHYKLYLGLSLYDLYKSNNDYNYLNEALLLFNNILITNDTLCYTSTYETGRFIDYDIIKYTVTTYRCEIYILLSEYKKALDDINLMQNMNSLDYYSYYLRGFIFEKLDMFNEAVYQYHKSISLNSKYLNSYVKLGFMYQSLNDTICIDYYNSALEIDSTNINVLYNVAKYYQDNIFLEGQKYSSFYFEKSISYYNKILYQDKFNENANYNLSYLYYFYLKDYETSANYASEAIYSNNNNHFAYHMRSLCFKKLNRIEESNRDSVKWEALRNK